MKLFMRHRRSSRSWRKKRQLLEGRVKSTERSRDRQNRKKLKD
jgi:hypothetical protein